MPSNILITGGAGFVGSNLALFLQRRLVDAHVVCFDNLIRRGSALNVPRLEAEGIRFVHGDIRKREQLFELRDIETIIECSAEPSVLAALDDPAYTIDTNLIGTIHCLELARRDRARFVFLSSSRVYPIDPLNAVPFTDTPSRFDWPEGLGQVGVSHEGVTEEFPLHGIRSLYGATKLCSEHLALEYLDMFDLHGVVNRLGIIAGPWQMGRIDQGLVGYWVARHKFGRPLKYIGYGGTGKQVRDAIHVDDVCELILLELAQIERVDKRVFNVGGGRANAFSLAELTAIVQRTTGVEIAIEAEAEARKSDVRIYITDNTAVSNALGWKPERGMDEIVSDIDAWISANSDRLKGVLG